jgi:hypothetical protein
MEGMGKLEQNEVVSYKNQFHRFVLKDGTVMFGRLALVDNQSVTIITSRNGIATVHLDDLERVI